MKDTLVLGVPSKLGYGIKARTGEMYVTVIRIGRKRQSLWFLIKLL